MKKFNLVVFIFFLLINIFTEKTNAILSPRTFPTETNAILDSKTSFTEADFNFEDCCKSPNENPALQSINKIQCKIQTEKEICQKVNNKYKKDCSKTNGINKNTIVDLFSGCIDGITNTTFSMLSFLSTIMRGLYSFMFDRTNTEALAFMESTRNYLNIQYEQAYEETIPPHRMLKAVSNIGTSLFNFLYNSTVKLVKNSFQEYQCLNTAGKTAVACQFISGVLVPPLTIFALVKYGVKGASKIYPKVGKNHKDFFKKSKNFLQSKKENWRDDLFLTKTASIYPITEGLKNVGKQFTRGGIKRQIKKVSKPKIKQQFAKKKDFIKKSVNKRVKGEAKGQTKSAVEEHILEED